MATLVRILLLVSFSMFSKTAKDVSLPESSFILAGTWAILTPHDDGRVAAAGRPRSIVIIRYNVTPGSSTKYKAGNSLLNAQIIRQRDMTDYYSNQATQGYGARDRPRSRSRPQYIPYEDLDLVRNQQRDAFNRPGAERRDLNTENLTSHRDQARSNWRNERERSADDAYYSRRRRQRQDSDSDSSRASSGSDADSRHRRQQGNRKALTRRAQSETRQSERTRASRQSRQSQQSQQSTSTYDGDVRGLVGRNLDTTPNGAMIAALGAGVGAIASRRFGGNHFNPKSGSQNWKTVGGAVIGGVAANVAVEQFRKRREAKKPQGSYADDAE